MSVKGKKRNSGTLDKVMEQLTADLKLPLNYISIKEAIPLIEVIFGYHCNSATQYAQMLEVALGRNSAYFGAKLIENYDLTMEEVETLRNVYKKLWKGKR